MDVYQNYIYESKIIHLRLSPVVLKMAQCLVFILLVHVSPGRWLWRDCCHGDYILRIVFKGECVTEYENYCTG